ncbi:MAG: hypothetical protein QG566_604 [Patescibacteria group bacterium]|jgi:uncharacterized protein with PQ loop repeat|nr:hypothetical protein [Patescibacteria group bacterium]
MTNYTIIGIISGLLGVLAYIPYITSIYKKKIQPHPFSWFLWMVLGFATFITYMGVGAKETLPLALISFVGPTVIFLITLKNWKGRFPKFDYFCLFLALLAIIIYIVFHQAAIALTLSLVGDLFAAMPTIRKTYKDPSSENIWTWSLFALGAVVALFAIRDFTYGVLVFPLYLAVFEIAMCWLILRKKY